MSNLTKILQKNFDVSYYQHLIVAGELADCMNSKVYLVGGAVRDVLLGKSVNDIDLVVVGDSEDFANQLASRLGGEITARSQFRFQILALMWLLLGETIIPIQDLYRK